MASDVKTETPQRENVENPITQGVKCISHSADAETFDYQPVTSNEDGFHKTSFSASSGAENPWS